MNTKFDVGQRVTYPVVQTADGNITGIAVSKSGVTRYAIGPKWYAEEDLNLAEEKPDAAITATEPIKESEPVKLYCVKSYEPGEWCTKGKIYEIRTDGGIAHDSGWIECNFLPFMRNGGRIRKAGTEWSKYLVPLVRRPAKVGEYIVVVKMDGPAKYDLRYDLHDILKVTHDDSNIIEQWKGRAVAFMNITHPDRPWHMCVIKNDEYLVLDGYTGDPA